MTFSLDGGLMLAVVVVLWVLVYIPNWGKSAADQKQVSSSGGNFAKNSSSKRKKSFNGVSQTTIPKKNIRVIRALFTTLLFASLGFTVYASVRAIESITWLIVAGISFALFLTAASTLRASRRSVPSVTPLTLEQLEAQRARMAYSIRESALADAKAEQLFDERAWVENPLPQSDLARRIGELEQVRLASVTEIESVRAAGDEKVLDKDELDRILNRRRAV